MDSPKPEQLHIVALGSSFAARPGIPPIVNGPAMRSGSNYAHLLAERLDARLTDLSVSGATLNNLLNDPQVAFGTTFKPQLELLPSDADVVTITAGGNDLNYLGGLTADVLRASMLGSLLLRLIPISKESSSLTAADICTRFEAVIDKIHQVAPGSRIFLVEYTTILGPHARPGTEVALNDDQIRHHQGVAHVLREAYALASKSRPECELVPITALSDDHGLGSEHPWVDGFSIAGLFAKKAPFHPNAEGMRAVADILYARLQTHETVSG